MVDPVASPDCKRELIGNREALATFGAPPLEHVPSILGAHANQKSVSFPAMAPVRLKRPFH
jgi:hypothetical protein